MKKRFFTFDNKLNLKETNYISNHKTNNKINTNSLELAKYMNIGYYLIIPLILGIFGGHLLDKLLKTGKLFFIICFSLGIVGTFYNLIKIYIDERKGH